MELGAGLGRKSCKVSFSAKKDKKIDAHFKKGRSESSHSSFISFFQFLGVSAYVGGLWLAAMKVTVLMATELGETDVATTWNDRLELGKASYQERLWTGEYYAFDTSRRRTIMSDQLNGHWILLQSGLLAEDELILPREQVQRSLRTIYEQNVLRFVNGNLGAVNG